MKMWRTGVVYVGVCATLAACKATPIGVCQPGEKEACVCENKQSGGALCLNDGSGFAACVCENSTGGAGGSGVGGSGVGGTGTGGSGIGGGTGDGCVATCCDGSVESGDQSNAQDCKFYEGFACKESGGPQSIALAGSVVWSAPAGCPSMAPCVANCCNGSMKLQGEQFDKDLCNLFAVTDGVCDQEGGVAKVFFDGAETANEISWNGGETTCGNCVSTCCDGSVIAGTYATAGDCNFWTGVSCNARGGPQKIEFGGNLSWGPASTCPSAKECKLVCQDGSVLITAEYDKDMCIFFKVGGDFCKNKGGNAAVYYDGMNVWP